MQKIIKEQRGVALYITVVILSIVLAIVLGLNSILIGQIRTVKNIGDSVVAIHAADSGVEEALRRIYYSYNDPDDPKYVDDSGQIPLQTGVNDYFYQFQIFCSKDNSDCYCSARGPECTEPVPVVLVTDNYCTGVRFCIKSVGNYRGTRRAIEVSI